MQYPIGNAPEEESAGGAESPRADDDEVGCMPFGVADHAGDRVALEKFRLNPGEPVCRETRFLGRQHSARLRQGPLDRVPGGH